MDFRDQSLNSNADGANQREFSFEEWAQQFRSAQKDKYENMQKEKHRAKHEETDKKYHRYLLGILLVEVAVIVVSVLVSL
jgi:hypothetical protein